MSVSTSAWHDHSGGVLLGSGYYFTDSPPITRNNCFWPCLRLQVGLCCKNLAKGGTTELQSRVPANNERLPTGRTHVRVLNDRVKGNRA